ncbi:MAG TPA: DUF4157 domain-containing protein, partial [Jatrophihabitantaceae bacterium]|nr:DUF4157 domain-containing protein [Jatrophihabitantaceae bacterium]
MDVARPEPVKAEPAHDLATIIAADIEFAESAIEAASGQLVQLRPTPGIARKSPSGSRAARGRKVQAKLAVGASNDPLEVEADVVAQRVVDALRAQDSDPIQRPAREAADPDLVARRLDVMRQAGQDESHGAGDTGPNLAALVRRHADVRRHAGHGPSTAIGAEGGDLSEGQQSSLRQASAGGQALPAPARRRMESALGVDFGDVRVHAGPEATALNEQMSARAFTVDKHVFFRDGLPDTSSADGQHLLAHELAHTIQQGPAPARRSTIRRDGDGYGSGSGTAVLDESAETESEEGATSSGVMFMDPSGVGHKEPDKSKAPSVLFMDSSGVGHKEPDKVKKPLPNVLFMDPSGVGHKEPDKAPTPSVLQMDDKGVGHATAENPEVASVQTALTGIRDYYMQRVNTVKDTCSKWDAFKTTALKGEQDALGALSAGRAVWYTEKADSGLVAATQAEAARTANTSAAKAKTDAHAIEAAFSKAWNELKGRNKNLQDNTVRFGNDKPRWLKAASPGTKIALDDIQAMLDQQAQGRVQAEAVQTNAAATLAEIDR